MTNLPSSSAIPGALVAFMGIATEALPDGSTVWFGQEIPTYANKITLQISEITGDQEPAELGPQYRREEKFSLICSLSVCVGGSPDFPGLLSQAMDNFALVSEAVGNNPKLNGAVRFAQVGNFMITAGTDANGLSALTLDFSVRCEARVNSLS